jgi:hypothetical protein
MKFPAISLDKEEEREVRLLLLFFGLIMVWDDGE